VDDIQMFAPALLKQNDIDPLQHIASDDYNVILSLFACQVFGGLAMIARRICVELTSPLARQKRTFDPDIIRQIWKQFDDHDRLARVFEARIPVVFGNMAKTVVAAFDVWVKSLQCCLADLIHLVDKCLKEKIAQAAAEQSPALAALNELSDESDRRTFANLRGLCLMLRASQAYVLHFGRAHLIVHRQSQAISFGGILLRSLSNSIQRLLQYRSCEEGGVEDWHINTKIADVEQMLSTLKVTSGSS
jgi:hypothetical protein